MRLCNSFMKQQQFINQVVDKIKKDENVIGLAVAGSFITHEMDEFSDVDLILVTADRVSDDPLKMEKYAKSFGDYLNGFTGEHVGEKRVLICLYDNPLLHVDIKFLTPDEFQFRVEDPVICWDRQNQLQQVIQSTKATWPPLDFQWIEDRFWTWIHYATLKLGRGEDFEALDFMSFLRTFTIAPMLQVKNGKLPRGLRKVEFNFPPADVNRLMATVPAYQIDSLFQSLENIVHLYVELRSALFPTTIHLRSRTEEKTLAYLAEVKKMRLA